MANEIVPTNQGNQLVTNNGSYLLSDELLFDMDMSTLLEMRERLEKEAGEKDFNLSFDNVPGGILIRWSPLENLEIPG